MKQWPFAHTIEMTYRLTNGQLEVATEIVNLSSEAMPVAIGFHPYFQLTDSPRDEWTIALGARTRWALDANKVPTGETVAIEQLFPNPTSAPLRDYNLDDVFSDLVRDSDGRATMTVIGKKQRLDVIVGAGYRSVVVWAPSPSGKGRGGGGDAPPGRAKLHLLRADGWYHQRDQHGSSWSLRRATDHCAGRNMARVSG